jgi:hypothetical protein
VFIPKPSGTTRRINFWGFLGIYLCPDLGQPVAAWGTVEPTNPGAGRKPIFEEMGLRKPNPRFVNKLEYGDWVHLLASAHWEDVSYRACALVDLSSPGVVENLVVQPLCKKLRELSGSQP